MIVEARIEELLEYVDKELKKISRSRKLPGGAVLVGGTSKIPGIAEFTKEKLQIAARVGKLQTIGGLQDTVEDPAYYTAVGLVILDMLLAPQNDSMINGQNSGVFGMVEGLFKRFKR